MGLIQSKRSAVRRENTNLNKNSVDTELILLSGFLIIEHWFYRHKEVFEDRDGKGKRGFDYFKHFDSLRFIDFKRYFHLFHLKNIFLFVQFWFSLLFHLISI